VRIGRGRLPNQRQFTPAQCSTSNTLEMFGRQMGGHPPIPTFAQALPRASCRPQLLKRELGKLLDHHCRSDFRGRSERPRAGNGDSLWVVPRADQPSNAFTTGASLAIAPARRGHHRSGANSDARDFKSSARRRLRSNSFTVARSSPRARSATRAVCSSASGMPTAPDHRNIFLNSLPLSNARKLPVAPRRG
jgi:hypothetical protein